MIKLKNWLPAILVMLFMFWLASIPGDTVQAVGLGKESYHINGHFLVFIVLGFALYKATKSLGKTLIIGISYGLLNEWYQRFVPGRTSGLFDAGVNSCGILLSVLILWKYLQSLPTKLKIWLLN